MKSKSDRSLSFRSLQELRNLESKFITTITALSSTLKIIASLEATGKTLMKEDLKTPKQDPAKLQGPDIEADCKELRALAACSLRCQAYLASVELMQSRVGRLVKLVRHPCLCLLMCVALLTSAIARRWARPEEPRYGSRDQ